MAGATGAADAVDIILRVFRQVVVDHQRNVVDVDAAGGDVGGDHHLLSAFAESLEDLDPLLLRNVSGEYRHLVAVARQIVLQP